MATDGFGGRLLVASPSLHDPNFERTVILLLEHGEGALGVVLNRPSDTAIDEPLPAWRLQAAEPSVVFVGGPVGEAAICLAHSRGSAPADGWQQLFGDLGTLDVARDPDEVGVPVDGLRVFAGYAGWGAGQLEEEIAAGAWFVLDAEPEDAFSPDPAGLWRRVLRRQRGMLSTVANFPADLSVN
jgi:putative transcriptional regulator